MSGEQARQFIDAEQVHSAYLAARAEFERRYRGSMSWKTVHGTDYLYRKREESWKSLGRRSPATEEAHRSFHEGRDRLRDRLVQLARRLDEIAPVNRAYAIGRMPVIAARVLRALDHAHLMGTLVAVVGTHSLYAYERLAGVQIAGAQLATGDVDLLYGARRSLKLLAPETAASGIMGQLRKADRSFQVHGPGSFRAVNQDGFMVDLIMPPGKNRMRIAACDRVGTDGGDLRAVEIKGLGWLVNTPKLPVTVIDARGYPLTLWVTDPRAFALHKAWLAEREDRQPIQRRRDAEQADLVATLIRTRLPNFAFDDPALAALPTSLRARAGGLGLAADAGPPGEHRFEPDW